MRVIIEKFGNMDLYTYYSLSPQFLQGHPFSFHSNSFSLVNCDAEPDPALPYGEVFTIATDRPVEILRKKETYLDIFKMFLKILMHVL